MKRIQPPAFIGWQGDEVDRHWAVGERWCHIDRFEEGALSLRNEQMTQGEALQGFARRGVSSGERGCVRASLRSFVPLSYSADAAPVPLIPGCRRDSVAALSGRSGRSLCPTGPSPDDSTGRSGARGDAHIGRSSAVATQYAGCRAAKVCASEAKACVIDQRDTLGPPPTAAPKAAGR